MRNKLFIPSEISWLSFNARVLQEANDSALPLKERIRFLGIYSNNRDEFFRLQVALLKKTIKIDQKKMKGYGRKDSQKILDQIHNIILHQQKDFNRIWKKIITELNKENVYLIDDQHLNSKQKVYVRNVFDKDVSSSIIPLFIDNMPQFPTFGDSHIFLGIVMQKGQRSLDRRFAIIEIPTKIHSRFFSLPATHGVQNIILLEDMIRFNLPQIFSHMGYTHFEGHMFKVTKDAQIGIDNDISTTLAQKIEKGVKNRPKALAIRLLYDKKMNRELLELLIHKLNLSHQDSIISGGYIRNFRDFIEFPAKLPDDETSHEPFPHPAFAASLRVSDVMMRQDVLLHLPYHSFNSIIDLLREAAMDPEVESIKLTAYRLAANSKICNALINAARNGKQVHVILELSASFDEEANLKWKSKLEEEGVKVFVGFANMKIHAKLCMIKKRVGKRIERYGFIGTGNLNEKTAMIYIDHFLLTSNRLIMADINRLFKALENPNTQWGRLPGLCKNILVSPINMREVLVFKINQEIKSAKKGNPAKILINLNSLSDVKLISKLYKAAAAGVCVQLIIRGIFCAMGDSKEWMQTMSAISIVDKYLEHSRIWFFHNEGKEDIYISSADWRARNLDHRIEVAIPIIDKALKDELKHILKLKLSDNVKARWLYHAQIGNKGYQQKCDNEHLLSNQYVVTSGKKVRSQLAIYHYLKHKRGSYK